MLRLTWSLLLVACSGDPDPLHHPDAASQADAASSSDAASLSLDPTPGEYRGSCDGSGAIAIDFTHFLAFSDNDQVVRFYQRGATAAAITSVDISATIGLTPADEADFEEAARVGNRVYVIGSHGRKKTGLLDPARYRLFAADVGATGTIAVTASTSQLLQQLLDPAHWDAPDPAVIAAIQAASQLDRSSVPDLAPKLNGTNIEALGYAPTATAPERLLIGFRNPQTTTRAVVVSLVNPAQAVAGMPARFGEAITLDLGGLGIRGMAWSEALHAVVLIAGPRDDGDAPFALYRWSGTAGDAPVLITALTPPAFYHPEAVVAYPGTRDVELLYDNDNLPVGGNPCNAAPVGQRAFRDQIVHVP